MSCVCVRGGGSEGSEEWGEGEEPGWVAEDDAFQSM